MDSTVTEKVCLLQERVAQRIGLSKFRTWFGESARFSVVDHQVRVLVPSAFAGNWIVANFMAELQAAAREVLGECADVAVKLASEEARAALTPHRVAPPPAPTPQRCAAQMLRGDLEAFVVGPCNRVAHGAARELVRSPLEAFKPLVLHGGCGLGKTHLLQGICNGVRRHHATLEWRYVSGEEFTNEFVQSVRGGRVESFRARFRRVDVLVIDDIHFLANKRATQEEFLHTFNAIDANGKTLVLSSDRHPRSIVNLSEPLVNRLISGVVLQLDQPDLTTRREILRRRAAEMNARLSDDVLDYVARRVERNFRELVGALYKLAALASLSRDPLTLDDARAALDEHLPRSRRAPGAGDVERVVGAWFGVPRDVMQSANRDRTVSLARAIAMYLARRHTGLSYPELGREMGRKNHSTVLMATKRIEELLAHDGEVCWKTPAGVRTEAIKRVLAELEDRIRAELSA